MGRQLTRTDCLNDYKGLELILQRHGSVKVFYRHCEASAQVSFTTVQRLNEVLQNKPASPDEVVAARRLLEQFVYGPIALLKRLRGELATNGHRGTNGPLAAGDIRVLERALLGDRVTPSQGTDSGGNELRVAGARP